MKAHLGRVAEALTWNLNMKWKGFYCSIYSEDRPPPPPRTTIEVSQLHAAILWHNMEM